MTQTLTDLLSPVIDITHLAGDEILNLYNSNFTITQKPDHTPVTTADFAAHDAIEFGLKKLTPNIPILSEESNIPPYAERKTWSRYWLVDPLDGTREFIKKTGEFTVNIALIENNTPVLGVIYAPTTNTCYFACKNSPAYKQTDKLTKQKIKTNKNTCSENFTVAGSGSPGEEKLITFMTKLGNYKKITMGSSLKSCLVAEGNADIYPRFGPTSEWDTAAAQIIVEQAGGQIIDTQLNPLRYNRKDSLLNPDFFAVGNATFDWQQYFP